MRKFLITAGTAILLASCTQKPVGPNATLEEHLHNPLFAEQYYETLVDRMTEFAIQKDPILEDEKKSAIIDDVRRDALSASQAARAKQREGTSGFFVTVHEFVEGEALYVDDMLYLGPTFHADPGPSLHLILSTAVDPREGEFPDEKALDLGQLQTPFGADQYVVPDVENPLSYNTVVLWDTKLERLHGFAQLNK